MPTYAQTPIRLQLVLIGNPPVFPIDANTNLAPKFWRSSNVGIDVGIFDAAMNPVDLSNLNPATGPKGRLILQLYKSQTDLVPLVVKQIDGSVIYPLITTQGWQGGTQQNATFALSAAETDQALGGLGSAPFWMVVNAILPDNSLVAYGAGPCTIYNAASTLTPSTMPTPSFDRQNLNVGNITVVPTSNIHTEEVTIGGAGGRTSNIIVGQNGLVAGAHVWLLLLAGGAPGAIDVQIFVGSLAGPNPFAFNTSGGTTRCLFHFYFDGVNLNPLEQFNAPF